MTHLFCNKPGRMASSSTATSSGGETTFSSGITRPAGTTRWLLLGKMLLPTVTILSSFVKGDDNGLGCKWAEIPDIIPDVDAEP